jgi:hypothetical protein
MGKLSNVLDMDIHIVEMFLCTGGEYYAPSSEGSISYLFCVEGGKVLSGR